MSKLTHVDAEGAARMVDVSAKPDTVRRATASGRITMSREAATAIREGSVRKGDVLAVARVAGIMAAKRTAELIPLCHPLPIAGVTLDLSVEEDGITATAEVVTSHATGVEMEAMTAVSVALLSIYDMAKAIDRAMVIGKVRLLAKSGGRSGEWRAPAWTPAQRRSRRRRGSSHSRRICRWNALPSDWPMGVGPPRRSPPGAPSLRPTCRRWTAMRSGSPNVPAPGGWSARAPPAADWTTRLAPGETARIFTGAPLPEGADTVLLQEDATVADGEVAMSGDGPAAKGSHIRRRGYDFAEGATLVDAGAQITPARIGLAATGGHGEIAVRRKVRVGLLSTGDELVPIGTVATGVKLPASNATMLAAVLAGPAVEVVDLGIAPDRIEALTAAIAGAEAIDLLITIGGASVGDHDLVRPALAAAGAKLDFWRAAVKPGKPLMAGRLGDTVVIGLPGNPVSAFVTSQIFVLPLIRAMAGAAQPLPPIRGCILEQALPANGSRAEYLRARRKEDRVVALAQQDSAGLVALAAADALIVRPSRAPEVAAGAIVEVIDIA